jgi:hypothetical protein
VDARAQTARGEAKQPAARADVEEALARERLDTEHRLERLLGLGDALVVEHTQEAAPVLTELETRVRGVVEVAGRGLWCAAGRSAR